MNAFGENANFKKLKSTKAVCSKLDKVFELFGSIVLKFAGFYWVNFIMQAIPFSKRLKTPPIK